MLRSARLNSCSMMNLFFQRPVLHTQKRAKHSPVDCSQTSILYMRHLLRKLLRASNSFPIAPIRRKLRENIKEAFRLNRGDVTVARIAEAEAALRVLQWLNSIPKVHTFAQGRVRG